MAADQSQKQRQRRRIWIAVAIILLLFAGAAAWKWTPMAEFLDVQTLVAWAASLRQSPALPLYVLAAYIVGSFLLVPITVLILVTAIVFGPLWGSVYALAGCLAGALATYALGYFLGRDFVCKLAGNKWQKIERKIDQTGIVAVATLRLLPVAPFTMVNVVSGAFKVRFWDYSIGSLLGLAPGIVITSLFAHQLQSAIRNPGIGTVLLLLLFVAVTVAGAAWAKRRFVGAQA